MIEKIQLKIVSNVLKLIFYSEDQYKGKILIDLTVYAKAMHVTLRKKRLQLDLSDALIQFVDAEMPANETINNLYSLII